MTAPATLYPFSEDGIDRAVADAMAMKTMKSTIMPRPELAEQRFQSKRMPVRAKKTLQCERWPPLDRRARA
jgi:hypothetical protein